MFHTVFNLCEWMFGILFLSVRILWGVPFILLNEMQRLDLEKLNDQVKFVIWCGWMFLCALMTVLNLYWIYWMVGDKFVKKVKTK
eukprot:snap_masked-scaffold_13-processed-gene-6.29-mRNA-1 protein AED:1.00 eAED:1.00 QI:0/0/0/0/1/1/2/0/84